MVALELNKLTGQVDQMGRSMAARQAHYAGLGEQARTRLGQHGLVTQELCAKIARARASDQSWRGAEPYGERMDERCLPDAAPGPVTLIAADGSQIYPDRHGIATYYLLNTGSIVVRQGSGQAPVAETRPTLFFEDRDLYDEMGHLRDTDYINGLRDRQEMQRLVELAQAERTALGGDVSRPILVFSDGPLLPWMKQQTRDDKTAAEIGILTAQMDCLRGARAIPVGYVDRPNSAYVLRTLELTEMSIEQIDRDSVRKGCYRLLSDRLLFGDLEPNQRTALFASTSEVNRRYTEKGHRILFFYLNVARRSGPRCATLARVELPAWAAEDQTTLDRVHQVVYAECSLTGYPYVLARAHEMAVVGTAERSDLETMLQQSMLRRGLEPTLSNKAREKQLLGRRTRR